MAIPLSASKLLILDMENAFRRRSHNKQRTFSKFCGNRNEKMLAEKFFRRTVIRLYDYFFSGRAK
jgi:hypothetical protein